jgi:hypothetical protein
MLALYDEFDTYWQNGGYKKISDIIFAECHIFIVSNLWFNLSQYSWLPASDNPRASRSFPRIAGSGNEIATMSAYEQECLGPIAVPFSCNQYCPRKVEQFLLRQISRLLQHIQPARQVCQHMSKFISYTRLVIYRVQYIDGNMLVISKLTSHHLLPPPN